MISSVLRFNLFNSMKYNLTAHGKSLFEIFLNNKLPIFLYIVKKNIYIYYLKVRDSYFYMKKIKICRSLNYGKNLFIFFHIITFSLLFIPCINKLVYSFFLLYKPKRIISFYKYHIILTRSSHHFNVTYLNKMVLT